MKWILLILCCMVSWVGLPAADNAPIVETALKKIAPHPRLMLTDARLQELKEQVKTDSVLTSYVKNVLKFADRALKDSIVEYRIPDGKRLLQVSRTVVRLVSDFAFAYRWTGDVKYLKRAVEQMDAACAFKDWNPSHFLDTAEMAYGIAIGYDWLYHDLTPAQRALYVKTLTAYALSQKVGWWARCDHNWNGVCNGGLAVAALAVAEDSPVLARTVLTRSVQNMPIALREYGPDGLWEEGIGYWGYMSTYAVTAMAAMQSAVDTDFGLSSIPGVDKTAMFPILSSAPSGHPVMFGDCGGGMVNKRKKKEKGVPYWELLWFAKQFDNPAWAAYVYDGLRTRGASLQHILFYMPVKTAMKETLPCSVFFKGRVEAVFMRTSWDDPEAQWLSVKAGKTNVNHAHLDAGTFEYEASGIRWAIDLGSDNYNMPGYFSRGGKNPKRWIYYRLNSESHNVMMINGGGQNPEGSARVIAFSDTAQSVTVDMKKAYSVKSLSAYTREFSIRKGMLTLTERVNASVDLSLLWGMTTDAEIKILPDGSAVLTREGKVLHARIVEPGRLSFSVGSCHRDPPENPNDGFRRLQIRYDAKANLPSVLKIELITP